MKYEIFCWRYLVWVLCCCHGLVDDCCFEEFFGVSVRRPNLCDSFGWF